MSPSPLLELDNLAVCFPTRTGVVYAANGISLEVEERKTLGIVGESGSGKTVTLRAVIGLVPTPGEVVAGRIWWRGSDLRERSGKALTAVRGKEIAMVFQDAGTSLNPLMTVGAQITEVLRLRLGMSRSEARRRAIELLERVGIPSPAKRYHEYPHQFSGGMRQRAMIALAIAPRPLLLLADEPTTALDVTIQDQVLELLADIQAETGMAIVIVSHDIGVIARICDTVAVMYAGRVLEKGSAQAVLHSPRHPYTRGLLDSMPRIDARGGIVAPIVGQPPNLADLPSGCPFAPRCSHVNGECVRVSMTLDLGKDDHGSACPFV